MPKQYPKELKDRAVRLVLDHPDDYESTAEAIRVIAGRLNIGRESLCAGGWSRPGRIPERIPGQPQPNRSASRLLSGKSANSSARTKS